MTVMPGKAVKVGGLGQQGETEHDIPEASAGQPIRAWLTIYNLKIDK